MVKANIAVEQEGAKISSIYTHLYSFCKGGKVHDFPKENTKKFLLPSFLITNVCYRAAYTDVYKGNG